MIAPVLYMLAVMNGELPDNPGSGQQAATASSDPAAKGRFGVLVDDHKALKLPVATPAPEPGADGKPGAAGIEKPALPQNAEGAESAISPTGGDGLGEMDAPTAGADNAPDVSAENGEDGKVTDVAEGEDRNTAAEPWMWPLLPLGDAADFPEGSRGGLDPPGQTHPQSAAAEAAPSGGVPAVADAAASGPQQAPPPAGLTVAGAAPEPPARQRAGSNGSAAIGSMPAPPASRPAERIDPSGAARTAPSANGLPMPNDRPDPEKGSDAPAEVRAMRVSGGAADALPPGSGSDVSEITSEALDAGRTALTTGAMAEQGALRTESPAPPATIMAAAPPRLASQEIGLSAASATSQTPLPAGPDPAAPLPAPSARSERVTAEQNERRATILPVLPGLANPGDGTGDGAHKVPVSVEAEGSATGADGNAPLTPPEAASTAETLSPAVAAQAVAQADETSPIHTSANTQANALRPLAEPPMSALQQPGMPDRPPQPPVQPVSSGLAADVRQPSSASPASVREVPFRLVKAVADGRTDLTVALRPAELGRLTIHLHFADGQLQVDVRAERPETLHLPQREADGFERSLRQAGLDLKDGGLQFSGQGDGGRQRSGEGGSLWHGLAREEGEAGTGEAGTERRGIVQPARTEPHAWQPMAADHLDVRL